MISFGYRGSIRLGRLALISFLVFLMVCHFAHGAKTRKRKGVKSDKGASIEDDNDSPSLPKTRILLSMVPWWKGSAVDEMERGKLNSRLFIKNYVSKSHPVLIKGGTNKWPDFESAWTDDSLYNAVGNRTVRVHSCLIQNFHIHLHKDPHRGKKIKMRFFLTRYNAEDRKKRQILDNISLNKKLPPMLSQMRKPAFTGALESVGQRLSMGAGQEIIPPRMENTENVVVCVDGPINVTLFPPTDFNYLYPIIPPEEGTQDHDSKASAAQPASSHNAPFLYSEVNTKRIRKNAKEHFPLVRRTHGITLTLQRGEMIYVPSYWWYKSYSFKRHVTIAFRYASNSRLADAAFEAARQRVKIWRQKLARQEAAESRAPGTGLQSQGMRGGEGKKGQTREAKMKEKDEL